MTNTVWGKDHGSTRRAIRSLAAGCALALAVAACGPGTLAAQDSAPEQGAGRDGGRGQFAGMSRAGGEVSAVAGNTLTLKTEEGRSMQVVVTDNTRVMKDRGPVRASDLHVGDGLMAFGNLDPEGHTLHAAVVMATDASELKAMRENLGKTYITGRVTAVNLDDARMTVERPDHVAQTIGFDESTSFKRAVRRGTGGGGAGAGGGEGRAGGSPGGPGGMGGGMGTMAGGGAALERAFANGESITLADIKVGDMVTGTGAVKGGVFVPVHLLESPPGARRPRGGEGAAGAAAASAQPGSAQAGPAGPGAR